VKVPAHLEPRALMVLAVVMVAFAAILRTSVEQPVSLTAMPKHNVASMLSRAKRSAH
jgi:hypothetical protein